MRIRRSAERGHANHGWLDTYHTFSFAGYYDPAHMGYRALRVINEDVVAPGKGFGTHPHDNMEIVTYVLGGAVQHRDSMGNGSVIRPGEVQRMTAGTGVTHSEMNPSEEEPLHLLQIWILPESQGLEPGYEQKEYPAAEKRNTLRLVASRDGREGSVTIHQDVDLYASVLEPGGPELSHDPGAGRCAWVQVARGAIDLNGERLRAGDGAALEPGEAVRLRPGTEPSEVLVFDLA